MAILFEQVTVDAQTALTEFSEEFSEALSASEADVQWATMFGKHKISRAIKTTYPIPVSSAGYHLREGDDEMRTLYEKSISIKPEEWQDGVQEKAHIVEAPDFTGWDDEPKRIAVESRRHPNKRMAALLAANPTLEFDAKALFANDHPVNIFKGADTFDNLHTAASIAVALPASKTRFRQRKAMNGESMGLRVTHMLCPAALEEQARDFLERDILVETIQDVAAAENVAAATGKNRHVGTVSLIVADELTEDDVIYTIDMNGPAPWIVQTGGDVEEIIYDKTSDRYKDSGMIAMKFILLSGEIAALPHAIEKITIT